MKAASVLREQLQTSHELLDTTLADVTADQLHWSPPGVANPCLPPKNTSPHRIACV